LVLEEFDSKILYEVIKGKKWIKTF